MEIIELKTLIDITKPANIIRSGQGTELEQNQYKNWITLQQCIGLRSIIDYDTLPTVETIDLKGLGFGTKYRGQQRVWTFVFRPDRSFAYDNGRGNILGLLEEDLNLVPVIKNLNETINISKATFNLTDNQFKNLIVKAQT